MTTLREYRVRPAAGQPTEVLARAAVDLRTKTVTIDVPGAGPATVDVVTARALTMLLTEAVYSALEPEGPYLRLESNVGDGWSAGGVGHGG